MITTPTVSIVMAVYNGKPYLQAALDSLRQQSLADFELIVVDDGSTDGTGEILRQTAVSEPRLILHHHPQNQGLPRALNAALALARGRYIARHDADDIAMPQRLAIQVAHLEQQPQLGLLGTAYQLIDAAGQPLQAHQMPQTDTAIRWQLLFHNPFCHSTVMFRRQLWQQYGGYNVDFAYSQDYDLWASWLSHTQAANLPQPLVQLRLHPASASQQQQRRQHALATQVAAQQLAQLWPGKNGLSMAAVEQLRRYFHAFPTQLTPETGRFYRLLFAVWARFCQRPFINQRDAQRIGLVWTRRLLAAARQSNWRELRQSGFASLLLRHSLPTAVSYAPYWLQQRRQARP